MTKFCVDCKKYKKVDPNNVFDEAVCMDERARDIVSKSARGCYQMRSLNTAHMNPTGQIQSVCGPDGDWYEEKNPSPVGISVKSDLDGGIVT